MSAYLKMTLLVGMFGVSLFATVNTFAQTQPQISLFSFYGDSNFIQSKDAPLLLNLTIGNPTANSIEKENQRNREILEQYSQTEEYKTLSEVELEKLSEQYPALEVPQINIGSATVPLIDLFDFQVRNAQGDVVVLNVRPLANNDLNARSVDLNSEETPYYQFVIESFTLQALPLGEYFIVAVLDSRAHDDMWNGIAFSNTVIISIVDQESEKLDSDTKHQLNSYYLINDEQYEAAEIHALAWTEEHPDSVDAWAQLGEALYGQGKSDDALIALEAALQKFREKYGNNPPELPELILDRINELETN